MQQTEGDLNGECRNISSFWWTQ